MFLFSWINLLNNFKAMQSAIFVLHLINVIIVAANDFNCNSLKSKHETVVSELLETAGGIIESAKKYEKLKESINIDENLGRPIDCAEVLTLNKSAQSGVYKIWPRSRIIEGSINVFCDMVDDGGAWTLIQKRGDFDSGKDYFFQDWGSYKSGFGDLNKDFWLGNDKIFALTNQRDNSVKFDLSDWNGTKTYATYDEFWIDDEDHKYTVHVTGYRGTAGDSFLGTNNAPFSTKDRDNDQNDGSCAISYKGAWWYTNCHASNLNGLYLRGVHESHADGVEWHAFRGHKYSLKDTAIKIRPKHFLDKLVGDRVQ